MYHYCIIPYYPYRSTVQYVQQHSSCSLWPFPPGALLLWWRKTSFIFYLYIVFTRHFDTVGTEVAQYAVFSLTMVHRACIQHVQIPALISFTKQPSRSQIRKTAPPPSRLVSALCSYDR